MANRKDSYIVGSWTNGGPEHDKKDIERITAGIASLPAMADELGTTSLWIVTNTRQDITRVETVGAAINSFFGTGAAQRLERGDTVTYDKYTLRQSTTRNLPSDRVSGAVAAIFPSKGTLDTIDRLYGRTSVIVIEHMDDAKAWKKKWNPIDLGDAADQAEDEDDDE